MIHPRSDDEEDAAYEQWLYYEFTRQKGENDE